MATYNKFNCFTADLVNGVHNFSSHTFRVMLTNQLPLATNTVKANITEIATGGGYVQGTYPSSMTPSNASGVEKIVAGNIVVNATGTVATFQYAVLYNFTASGSPLIAWFDYGSAVNMTNGESFTVSFDATNGLFTIT